MIRSMKRALTSLLAGVGLVVLSTFAHAQSTTVAFQITNNTLSGGDPIFPVVSDVTFQNLALTELVGSVPTSVTLFDPTHTAANTLNTSGNDLESNPFSLPGGGFSNVTLTGIPSLANMQLEFAPGAPLFASGPLPVLFADFANSAPAGYPAVGQLSLFDTTTGNVITSVNIYAVPEPGAMALLVSCGLGFAAALRKRRAIRVK